MLPWPIVGLAVAAAFLMALFGPFGQIHCSTRYVSPSEAAQQQLGPESARGHLVEIQLCINEFVRPMTAVP